MPDQGPTVLDQIVQGIGDDGSVPPAVARQLFQLAYGGLASVQLPAGRADDDVDGTMALAAMQSHRNELNAADQAALDAIVAPSEVSVTIAPSGGSAGSLRRAPNPALACPAASKESTIGKPAPASDPDVVDFRTRVEHWRDEIEARLGVPLGIPIDLTVYPAGYITAGKFRAAADTWTYDDQCQGGRPSRCSIRFFQGSVQSNDQRRDLNVAHEVWHCFEAAIVGDRNQAYSEPYWILEGQAAWVSAKVTGDAETRFFTTYLRTSARPLLKRSYDALGFYTTMESLGTDMFPALIQILGAGTVSGTAAYQVALADTGQVLLDDWSEMYYQESGAPGWDYSRPTGGPPPTNFGAFIPDAGSVTVSNGTSKQVGAPAYAINLVRVHPSTDFVHVTGSAHTSLLDDANAEHQHVGDEWFCTHDDPEKCKCPEGTDGTAPDSTFIQGDLRIAQTAGDQAAAVTISGESLDSFCTKPDKYCADVKALLRTELQIVQDVTSGRTDLGTPAYLQSVVVPQDAQLTAMATDAPPDIAPPVKAMQAAYHQEATLFADAGYDVTRMDQDAARAARVALRAAVTAQWSLIVADAQKRCGVTFPPSIHP